MSDRRGFLRGLATLPLIGGSVALIGSPSGVAVPVTDAVLRRYAVFLTHEYRTAVTELAVREGGTLADMHQRMRDGLRYGPITQDDAVERVIYEADASARAALVLAAVGCPLTGGANV